MPLALKAVQKNVVALGVPDDYGQKNAGSIENEAFAQCGNTREMRSYIRCFLHYARYKAAVALAMMVLLGLLEGSGLLLLLPMLTLLGLGEGHPDNFVATAIPALLTAGHPSNGGTR